MLLNSVCDDMTGNRVSHFTAREVCNSNKNDGDICLRLEEVEKCDSNKLIFQKLFESTDLVLHVCSFIDLRNLHKLRLLSKNIHALVHSAQLWNMHIHNLNSLSRNTLLSYKSRATFSCDRGVSITNQELKALHIYCTVLKNIYSFFTAYTPDTREYPFTLSLTGDIAFSSNSEGAYTHHQTYILLTKESDKIENVYRGVAQHYQNTVTPRAIFTYGIVRWISELKCCVAEFIDESKTNCLHEVMRLFVRFLNTIASQRKIPKEQFCTRLTDSHILAAFEDVTHEQAHIIQGNQKLDGVDTIHAMKLDPIYAKRSELMQYPLWGKICPEKIFMNLILPQYEADISQGELVVIKEDSDQFFTFQYVKKVLEPTPNGGERERYYLLWKNIHEDFVIRPIVVSASNIYRVPQRLIPHVSELDKSLSGGKKLCDNQSDPI